MTHHIAIIGAGIAGLSAAYHLQKEAARQDRDVHITIFDASARPGGKLRTERIDGFIIEAGPDSYFGQKPDATQLIQELGLAHELIGARPEHKGVYIRENGRLVPLPEGVMLIIPTRIIPFALSPLFSPWAKLRMGLEVFIPPRKDDGDETLADFIRRRLGEEALERLAEPLLAGIHNADAEKQSIMATFPRFRALEKQHGSLIRGMMAMRRRSSPPPAPAHSAQPNLPRGAFISLREGMESLVQALMQALKADLHLQTPVKRIQAQGSGFLLHLAHNQVAYADQALLATPAYAAATMISDLSPKLAAGLRAIRYVDTGVATLAYRTEDIPAPRTGYGILIPRKENRRINAITWTSRKWAGRAPEGYELLRVFFGGSRRPDVFALSDEALLAAVREELRDIMGIYAEPTLVRIHRWPRASAQYDVGHLERIAALEAACPANLHLIGSAYRGVGVPDCIRQGRIAAERALALTRA
ncbi:MAG: protoporphyrinogen oxidase [Chloroflexi bacterium]|nr:protoporphyrinogen oxidase [Chloroflexota bacterium]